MNVIFVSEMRDFDVNASSTQLLTRAMINGMKQNGHRVHFIAVIEANVDSKRVRGEFAETIDELTIVRSRHNFMMRKGKYYQLFRLAADTLFPYAYERHVPVIDSTLDDTVLLSHAPYLESVLICGRIKKKYPALRYIQYWSDPYALGGKSPETYSYARLPHRLIERHLLGMADDIVYLTDVLRDMQKRVFPKYARSMRSAPVCYLEEIDDTIIHKGAEKRELALGYAGNYQPQYRNLRPLYEAVMSMDGVKLVICGNGRLPFEANERVSVMKRVPYEALKGIEDSFDVSCVVLNYSTPQIPGKIFYSSNRKQHILVILDGAYKQRIREYLETYKRYIFCENAPEDIARAINDIISGKYSLNEAEWRLCSPGHMMGVILRA